MIGERGSPISERDLAQHDDDDKYHKFSTPYEKFQLLRLANAVKPADNPLRDAMLEQWNTCIFF